jgi:nitrite reductase (NO-forming)
MGVTEQRQVGQDGSAASSGDRGVGTSRDPWILSAVGLAMGCLLVALVAVGLAFRYADERDGGAAGPPVTFDVELGDLYVKPSSIEVPAGSPVVLRVTNAGAMSHDLQVGGTDGTRMLAPGESQEVTVGPFEADTQAWCTVPGHKEAGMVMDIRVTGATAGSAGLAAASAVSTDSSIDFNAEPPPGWKPFDPALQPAPGGTEHAITLRATETPIEVAPGVVQELWTFNGQYPGPVLRGKVGDLFTVTLVNEGKIGHSIDFHASKVAWNDEMRTIAPGESLVYQFEAKHAGLYMYHCGTAPALHHIGNGMFGAILIDPPDLAPVDHEMIFIQSELYLGPPGQPGDLSKMQADAWDAVVFNGYVNQYRHAPIRVEPGERVRAWVLDAGPSENSSFHIVGTVFDTVFKEGTTLLRPDARRGGAQTLDLQPAQGGYVEFSFDEPGLYPIVTHKFSNVGKGALGLFQAGEVDTTSAGGH